MHIRDATGGILQVLLHGSELPDFEAVLSHAVPGRGWLEGWEGLGFRVSGGSWKGGFPEIPIPLN